MIGFTARLLENPTVFGYDNGVGSDDEIGVRYRFEVNLECGGVDIHALLMSSCRYIFERPKCSFVKVLGLSGWKDFKVGEAKLRNVRTRLLGSIGGSDAHLLEQCLSPRRGGCEDHSLGVEVLDDRKI